MMDRTKKSHKVYGKRARAAPLFSTIFDSSSPDKVEGEQQKQQRRRIQGEKDTGKKVGAMAKSVEVDVGIETKLVKEDANKRKVYGNEGLGEIENQMESLKIKDADLEGNAKEIMEVTEQLKRSRKVLRTKDANANAVATNAFEKKKRRIKPEPGTRPVKSGSQITPLPSPRLDTQDSLTIRLNSPQEECQNRNRRLLEEAQDTALKNAKKDSYAHIRSLLNLCSDPAARPAPTSFGSWSSKLEPHFAVSKIAEASYGEVYRLSLKASIPGFTKSDESVLKIMALKPSAELCLKASQDGQDGKMSKADLSRQKKISWMSSPASVISEVQLLQLMTPIPGFTNFRELRILQGRPAPAFVAAWKAYNKSKKKGEKSVFPDPSRKANYDESQLWAVVEMQDAGCDLENIVFQDIWSAWDVFWGVAVAIGKGEKEVRFEHRDLHLGNICIRSSRPPTEGDGTDSDTASALTAPKIKIDHHRKLGFTGLETTIIDYTLSRADIASSTSSSSPTDATVAYLDLEADPHIFSADATHEYQYEIYRQMRSAVYTGRPLSFTSPDPSLLPAHLLERHPNAWHHFHPLTNLVWLHFLLHRLLENVVWPSADPELEVTLKRVEGKEKTASRRARKIENALLSLREMLDPERLGMEGDAGGVWSVGELVAVALVEGWLGEEDVVGVPDGE